MIAFSISFGSIFRSFPVSTYTGFAPMWAIAPVVATKEIGVVITSSFF